ncbi:MAG TPA: DUF3108 domain-containing protein, partial [Terriglobia bacterium]|nr:DUF3108 domain-containing protein [Terriglobia bacterium]
MKRSRITGVCLAAALALGPGRMRAEDPAPASFMVPGETLSYDVTWSVFPAGRVVATLIAPPKGSGGNYEVKTTAESRGFVSLLYDVEDEFHSFFNPTTLCSQSISKKVSEGRRHKQTNIQFD